jgi:hypothetical protein
MSSVRRIWTNGFGMQFSVFSDVSQFLLLRSGKHTQKKIQGTKIMVYSYRTAPTGYFGVLLGYSQRNLGGIVQLIAINPIKTSGIHQHITATSNNIYNLAHTVVFFFFTRQIDDIFIGLLCLQWQTRKQITDRVSINCDIYIRITAYLKGPLHGNTISTTETVV